MLATIAFAALIARASPVDPAKCWDLDLQAHAPLCHKIAELGRFDRAKFGPPVGGRATVEARYEPTYGTGFRDEEVALLQEHGGRWEVIWKHQAVKGTYYPWPKVREARYRWKYVDQGARILISGEHIDGARRATLPAERACFQPGPRSFASC